MGDPSPNSGKEPPEGQLCAGPEQAGRGTQGGGFFRVMKLMEYLVYLNVLGGTGMWWRSCSWIRSKYIENKQNEKKYKTIMNFWGECCQGKKKQS